MKVRLLADLSRYHSELLAGLEGETQRPEAAGPWSRGSDRFVPVLFPGVGTFDVLWKSLEIVDAAVLADIAARKAAKADALRTAQGVVVTLGPNGGFRSLQYEYTDTTGVRRHESTGFKDHADELTGLFQSFGIPVASVRLPPSPKRPRINTR